MKKIYCLVPKSYWEQFADREEYISRGYAEEGFIHATKGDDLVCRVADRVYITFTEELYLLVVAENQVSVAVKYETASDGLSYPHIYGPLNIEAVVDVKRMEKQNGNWTIGTSIT